MLLSRLSVAAAATVAVAVADADADRRRNSRREFASLLESRSEQAPEGLSLRCVTVLMRHGARTPVHQLPPTVAEAAAAPFNWSPSVGFRRPLADAPLLLLRDPARPADPQPAHPPRRLYLPGGAQPGLLTAHGQDQMLRLGRRLRRDYLDSGRLALDTGDLRRQLHCRSTAILRCVQSLSCTLAGLFEGQHDILREGFLVSVKDMAEEDLFPNFRIVPEVRKLNLANMQRLLRRLPEYETVRSELHRLLQVSGDSERQLLQREPHAEAPMYFLRDDLVAREAHGGWLHPSLLSLMPEIHRLCAVELLVEELGPLEFWHESLPYAVGRWLHELCSNVAGLRAGRRHHRLQLFSTHDSMLLPVLLAIGFEPATFAWPPFASAIVFEFYTDSADSVWVRILYNDRPVLLPGSGGREFAPVEAFEQQLGQFVCEPSERFADDARVAGAALNQWYCDRGFRCLRPWPPPAHDA